jgi:hypothetical protein
VDILSSCKLINYFGKTLLGGSSGIGSITLKPVMLQKGATKVALYGLGNIRDERLGRMFQVPGAVTWCVAGGVLRYLMLAAAAACCCQAMPVLLVWPLCAVQ